MPTGTPASLSQTTLPSPGNPVPAAPQQSLSTRHRLPSTWQPLAGWQTKTPVGPYGAQRRLQHSPQPLHTWPSTTPHFAGPVGGSAQVPSTPLALTLQIPEQQSLSRLQASPTWMHHDEPSWHLPLLQSREQQSMLLVHALPAVWQAGLSAWQLPPEQMPLQQSDGCAHV
jgi:hypothetical protein